MSEALVAKITEALDEARMGECMISASALAAIREALSSRPEGELVPVLGEPIAYKWAGILYRADETKGYMRKEGGALYKAPAEYVTSAELARLRAQSPAHSEPSLAMVGAQAGAVPAGWRLVPLEPSKAMLDAAAPFPEHLRAQRSPEWAASMEAATIADQMVVRRNYIAMLSAAPSAPVAEDERVRELEQAFEILDGLSPHECSTLKLTAENMQWSVLELLQGRIAAHKAPSNAEVKPE